MANRTEALFATVVHVASAESRTEALFTTVVHAASLQNRTEALFSTVVHSADQENRSQGLFATVVHTETVPGGGAPITKQGESMQGHLLQGIQTQGRL